ncbi:hypothetical protein [Escherichia coli]|uniref:hypothetical protein n=1 Tax=Escherichia coli TaxID=562 RepID=UPI001B0AFF0A|nr:hypothetical protein [Escherichia coli]HBA6895439.1 hypothetical protein [Escherichia coli]HBA7229497.1 hypothetical protein [Escherichia coli]HBA9157922.1 hypothetical protein [Escherichia coli]
MDGFAQGLLAGFSTVDQAMTRRKELGLREAQLAQQQKNTDRAYEFAQSQFEHSKDVDQRNFDYKTKVDDRDYALKEREFNAAQNYRNASLGMEQQRLQLQKYNQRRLEYNDMIANSQQVMTALGQAVEAGDRDTAVRLFGMLPKGHPFRVMSTEGYVAKSRQAVNNLQKIFDDEPDKAIASLNTPETLDALSGAFAPELQQRIGMQDPSGKKTVKEARIGSIVPAQKEGYVLIGLDLTYNDGSTAHKPVTEYGSAHPEDKNVLEVPVDTAVELIKKRNEYAEVSKNYGYFMPKKQGLSVDQLQKGASQVAIKVAQDGGDAQGAVTEYYASMGLPQYQQQLKQQKIQQVITSWAGGDPDKQAFAREVASRQPEMLEPQNQKLLENGYANFLRIQKAKGEQARDDSAASASEFIRGLKQNYAQ